ncbi:MAG: hypothetical protein R2856_38810 [Caldilineaceae bacterium]
MPGMTAVYYLTLSNSDGLTHTVHISDSLPSGVVAVNVSASSAWLPSCGRLHRRLGRSTRPGYVTGDDQDRSQD